MTANPGERSDAAPTRRRGRIPADTLSNRLTLARKLAGLTIEQAATAAGVKSSSWANWEQGKRPQRETDVIGQIADALDIDFNWLLLGGPLEGPQGRPVRPPVERATDVKGWYRHLDLAAANRPSDGRPKVRTDSRGPIGYGAAGRRPNRVNFDRAPEALCDE